MDETDVRIFCEMAFGSTSFSGIQDRHVNPSEIGRKVGIDEKTVRVRVRKMEEDGFIKYYQVAPNLDLFGLKRVGFHRLKTLSLLTKYRALDRIHETPMIVEVIDYIGPILSVSVAAPTNKEVGDVVDRIASEFEMRRWELYGRSMGECKLRLDSLDWQIIKELRYSARRSSTDLANALSITPRMAEYRIRRLLDSGAMFVHATIDTKKQTGPIFHELELTVDEQHRSSIAADLVKKFGDRLWSTVLSKGTMIASLFGFSLSEVEDAAMSSYEVAGVRSSSQYILKETIEPRGPNWIDKLIERQDGQ